MIKGGVNKPMSSEEIYDKVKEIIVEQLGVAETAVAPEASFIDDLGADSLDIVELIMALIYEEEFYSLSFFHVCYKYLKF